jgi:hypothetical protein
METPKSIEHHQADYKKAAWEQYSLQELGMWVHLFVKRAGHRDNTDKKVKDLHDAQNYLNMMQSHINAAKNS